MPTSRHPLRKAPEQEVFYELEPEGNPSGAIESIVRDIKAAHDLGIPFEVSTVRKYGFRFGGNIEKATVRGYRLTLGRETEIPDPDKKR